MQTLLADYTAKRWLPTIATTFYCTVAFVLLSEGVNAIATFTHSNFVAGITFASAGAYIAFRVCFVGSQLSNPPRLLRPRKFGDVRLNNPRIGQVNCRSLSLWLLTFVGFLVLVSLSVGLRKNLEEISSAELYMPDFILAVGAVAGWLYGLYSTTKRNGLASDSPPISDYSLFFRPYPANPWMTMVAMKASSFELVVIVDPHGSDATSIWSYLLAVLSRRIPRYYWTEADHWLLAVSDAAIHARQVIVDLGDWSTKSKSPRGLTQETMQTLLREQHIEVAYTKEKALSAPHWAKPELLVTYELVPILHCPRNRKSIVQSVRLTLQLSTKSDSYLPSKRYRRGVALAKYLDEVKDAGLTDEAHSQEFDQILSNFSSSVPLSENLPEKESQHSILLSRAEALLGKGSLSEAKECLTRIAKEMPEEYILRTDSGRSVQLRARDLADFLHQAIAEGSSERVVEWAPQVYPRTCYLLGWLAVEDNDLLTAVSWLQRGVGFSPDDTDLLAELGTVYNKAGLPDFALDVFSRILKLGVVGDLRARALRGRGYALVELKRYEEARDSYLRSLEIDPSSEIARAELREIEDLANGRP